MVLADVKSAIDDIALFLKDHRHRLTGITHKKELKEGTSTVLTADLQAERDLVPVLTAFWRDVSVLCEEAEHSSLVSILPDIQLLPYKDDVRDLPPDLISVDGLDGSALYANGELGLCAISAGLLREGKPTAAFVMPLDTRQLHSVGVYDETRVSVGDMSLDQVHELYRPAKECLIGIDDNKSVDRIFRELVIHRLTESHKFRYPLNVPAVAGGIKVLHGNLAAYVTSNARHWDIAGTAALCTAAGNIVRCLDGSDIPWNCVRMPPVVFARDEEAFDVVYDLTTDYRLHAVSQHNELNT